MKTFFWKLLLFLFILLVSAYDVHASFEKIIEVGIFEIYEDSINPDCEQYLLDTTTREYKSYLKKENALRLFSPLIVKKRYYFQAFPELKLYNTLGSIVLMSGRDELLFSCALVNCRDSSLYFFGGDTVSFNNVINAFLPDIIKNDLIKDLISLYLYSLSTKFSHYPLYSMKDYTNMWISYNLEIDNIITIRHEKGKKDGKYDGMLIFPKEEMDRDIKAVDELIEDYKISLYEGDYIARLFTWEELDGKIEFWRFKINDESFEIMERITVAEGLGPFMWWFK